MKHASLPLFFLSIVFLGSPLFAQEAIYTYPGVISYQEGEWVGGDHLSGLPKSLGVVVEVVKPSEILVGAMEAKIRSHVTQKLEGWGMESHIVSSAAPQRPLPFLHILIFIYPAGKEFALVAALRLFENVTVTRASLQEGVVWQAITWENQTFSLAPQKEVQEKLERIVDNLVDLFLDRYTFFNEVGSMK